MLNFLKNRIKALGYLPGFLKDYSNFKKQLSNYSDFRITKLFPILVDKHEESASLSGFYFYQDLLVAQKIFHDNPEKHVDI